MPITLPEDAPKPGEFYYHFKHDTAGSLENGAYRIDRVCHDRDTHKLYVAYRGFDTATEEYQLGIGYMRGLDNFLKPAEDKDGREVPRFRRIDNHELLTRLRICFENLYAEEYTHPARWGKF